MPDKKKFTRICDFDKCDEVFTTTRKTQRFCSNQCRSASYYWKDGKNTYYIQNKEYYKRYYQKHKKSIKEYRIKYLKRIYNECEERMKDGVIKNATQVHEIFSYLNHHPHLTGSMLLLIYPRLSEKLVKFMHSTWFKFTEKKYNIAISNEEQDLISNTLRDFLENENVKL